MKIINPTQILNAMLEYSNVPEAQPPEPDEYDSATGYTQGQQVSVVLGTDTATITHGIYESTFDGANTNHDPTIQTDQTYWKFVGSTVRWAMFNEILQDKTIQTISRNDGLTLPSGVGNYASSPDIEFPTEKIIMYAKVKLDDVTPASPETIFAKAVEAGDEQSLILRINSTGNVELITTSDGTVGTIHLYTSSEAPSVTDGEEFWLKIVYDADNGVNSTANFYYSLESFDSKDLLTWIEIGVQATDIQTSIYNSTAILELGSRNAGADDVMAGSIQQFNLYDGIDEETMEIVIDYNRIDEVDTGTSTSWRTGQVWTEQGTASFGQDISGIVADLNVGSLQNSIALMNLSAATVQIIGKETLDGEVYNQSFNVQSTLGINGMYAWLFKAITFDKNLVVLNLPAYLTAKYRIIITAAETAECGACVVGNEFDLGATQYDARYGIENYSVKSTDAITGAVTVSSGTFKSIADVEVKLPADNFSIVLDTLTDLRDAPVVWIGSEFISGMIQYGYYKSFTEVYSNYSQATCLLEIEGL